jgi:hypothetical protein
MTALDPVSPSDRHFPPDRLLYGNLVSSPHYLRNLEGRSGVYFLFPDVSVRRQGRYVLQLTLMRLSRYASARLEPIRLILRAAEDSTHQEWFVWARVALSWHRHAHGPSTCGHATHM